MWEINNKTPFASEGSFKYDHTGKNTWIVIIKAGFDILPGNEIKTAEDQPEILRSPEYNFEPGISSIKHDIDFIIDKPATDVILNGSAIAPSNKPVKKLEVGLKLGQHINKKLIVTGDRVWRNDILGTKSLTIPFAKMPIVYERAFGGTDITHKKQSKHGCIKENPVGTGFARKSANLKGQKVPNIENKKCVIKNQAAGFGAIAAHWEPRASFAGKFNKKNSNSEPISFNKDFDLRYNQQAPLDQQVKGYLTGKEQITLKNLHKDSSLSFKLPDIKPICLIRFDMSYIEKKPNLHTVIIEPDDNKLVMVWHTAIECHRKEHLLQETIIRL